MPKITDPDSLAQTTSVIFEIADENARRIILADSVQSGSSNIDPTSGGSNTGVTMQALYSFCKEEWKTDPDLIKIPFPFISITKNQFDLINAWDFGPGAPGENDRSRYLIRDAGWSLRSGSGNVSIQEWVGVITLGTLTAADQVYYLQTGSFDGRPVDFQMPGSINQGVKVYSSSDGGNPGFDYRDFLKVFVRTWGSTYDDASIQDDLQVTEFEYTTYALPLTNATDVKITEAVSASATGSPYNEITIAYLSGSGFGNYADGQTYEAGRVVYDAAGTLDWWITDAGGTTVAGDGTVAGNAGTATFNNWTSSVVPGDGPETGGGSRDIGGTNYAYNIIINAGSGKNNPVAEIYTRVQYELKIDDNINDGSQTSARSGSTSDSLLRFVGDTLITSDGVFIDNFQDADTNTVDFYDVSGTVRRFPFVSTGLIQFNDNLSTDASASFFMFFTDLGAEGGSGSYGSQSAIIVLNNDSLPISGNIAGSSSYSFTFDYDNNGQGGRTSASDAAVTVVAIGLETAQFVSTTSTIARSKTNNISLVSALERNYENPV